MSTAAPSSRPIDAGHAEVYPFERIRAVKDALHLILGVQLRRLPNDARILLAGAGTGAEMPSLASLHPGWRFTLADPSETMLAVARRHAESEGFADHYTFHVGFVSSLPAEVFDTATSLLVSQLLTDATARRAFSEDIAARLMPGAVLFNADLAADREAPGFEAAMDLWLDLLDYARGSTPESSANYRAAFGRDFAAHSPTQLEVMTVQARFTAPVACYQASLIHGWVAKRC